MKFKFSGFTLVEMAIVLAIMALILGTGLTLLSAQQDQQRIEDTNARLNDAREALIGFAIAKNYLPCPADPTIPSGTANAGMERQHTEFGCSAVTDATKLQGDFPWATLGLPETDAWGHRFTYRVSIKFARNAPTFILSDEGDIDICDIIQPTLGDCVTGRGSKVAANMPTVIVSHGANGLGAYLPSGQKISASGDTDEAENANTDNNFVSKTLTPVSGDQFTRTFDDQVIWLSQYTLFNRMVQAGKLP